MKRFILVAMAALSLSGCATLGLNRTRDLCQDSRNALTDAISAELIADAVGKGQDIAHKLRLAGEAAVAANCPAPVAP